MYFPDCEMYFLKYKMYFSVGQSRDAVGAVIPVLILRSGDGGSLAPPGELATTTRSCPSAYDRMLGLPCLSNDMKVMILMIIVHQGILWNK